MIREKTRVILEWEDITDHSDDDWNDTPEALPTTGMKTTGYLACDWKPSHAVLRICRDISAEEGTVHGVRALPAGCISTITNTETGEQWELASIRFKRVARED